MMFDVLLTLEAPSREDGEPIDVLGPLVEQVKAMGLEVTWKEGGPESGAWEDEDEGRHTKLAGYVNRATLDKLVDLFELRTNGEEVSVLGGGGGYFTMPALSFPGACRFDTSRRPASECLLADAAVTPMPTFKPRRSKKWQRKAWEKIKACLVELYG